MLVIKETHLRTKSANDLMLGRQVSMPVDLMLQLPITTTPVGDETVYVGNLRHRLQEAYEVARENLGKGAERQKRYYYLGTMDEQYQVGDLVWLLNESQRKGKCPKLQRKWLGPMIVEAKVNNVTYKLRVSPTKTRVVHFDKLKPYLAQEVPKWVPTMQDKFQKLSSPSP